MEELRLQEATHICLVTWGVRAESGLKLLISDSKDRLPLLPLCAMMVALTVPFLFY